MEWIMQNLSLLLIGGLGTVVLLLGFMTYGGGHQRLRELEPAAQILSSIVLIMTVLVLSRQLGHIQDQNELQRAVASKGSIQELNKVLLDKQQEDFLRFVFPEIKGEKARQSMMAFSLMNSLELLYLTQRERVSRDDFKNLLRGFTRNVRGIWDGNFATVYHPDFQKIVEEVFDETPPQNNP